jgi:hypothetical protein
MAVLWASATWDEVRPYVDWIGDVLLGALRETPAGVLLLVGLATMWVGWLVRKRKDRD